MTTGRRKAARAPQPLAPCSFDYEPSLRELIDDPVMQAVMARDGVDRAMLFDLIADVRMRLRGGPRPRVRHERRRLDLLVD